ncbi:MAG: hypothetical protein OQK77_09005 [Psychromonas sp.]|nr:hypothetical protein [Psychromonas sp.]
MNVGNKTDFFIPAAFFTVYITINIGNIVALFTDMGGVETAAVGS